MFNSLFENSKKELEVPKIFNVKDVKNPIVNYTGEVIYELTGPSRENGEARNHSIAYVIIPPECSSKLHYHPVAEETYFVISGNGKITIDEIEKNISPNDAILITPGVKHQIFTTGKEPLVFVVSCAPVWEPTNTVFLDEEK